MDDYERRWLAEEQTRASERAADASARAAAAVEGLRQEASAREARQQQQDRKQEEAESQAFFGTTALCASFITRALTLNPALRSTLRDHYAMLLTESFKRFWELNEDSYLENKWSLSTLEKYFKSMSGREKEWVAAFGPMPSDLTDGLMKCKQGVEDFREEVRVIQEQQARSVREEAIISRRFYGVVAVVVILAIFGWFAIDEKKSNTPTETTATAVPPPPTPVRPRYTEIHTPAPPSREFLGKLPGVGEPSLKKTGAPGSPDQPADGEESSH